MTVRQLKELLFSLPPEACDLEVRFHVTGQKTFGVWEVVYIPPRNEASAPPLVILRDHEWLPHSEGPILIKLAPRPY